MSVANKDRFVETGLRIPIDKSSMFPPSVLRYKDKVLSLLGTSNKEDLIPVNFDMADLQKVLIDGQIGQYIYNAPNGDIYDVCLYKDGYNDIYIYGIRTRQLPDKKGKKKEKEEVNA